MSFKKDVVFLLEEIEKNTNRTADATEDLKAIAEEEQKEALRKEGYR